MDHWEQNSLRRLQEIQPDQAYLAMVTQQKLNKIIELLQATEKASTSSPIISNTGINFSRLLQWPMPLYLISAGLLAANFKVPEVTELIKVFAGLQ